jgi:hypothetical protein
MSRPKILSAIFLITPGVVLLMAQAGFGEPAAESCQTKPGLNTPRGSHWFYRINRANQHCWYLGSSDAHARASAVGTTTAAAQPIPPQQSEQIADAASPQAAPTAPSTVHAPVAPAPVAPTAWPSAALPEPIAFTTRWPENLPHAKDVDEAEPVATSNSYANDGAAADAAQMPAQWSALDAERRAPQNTLAEAVLRYFSVAGGLAIPAVLLAGWAAKYARRRDDRDEPAADVVEAADVPLRRPLVRRRLPTDPADDLKTSLAELMRDLHRVDSVLDARPRVRPAIRQPRFARQTVLTAAE